MFRSLCLRLLIVMCAGACLAQGASKHPKISSTILDALRSGRLETDSNQSGTAERSMSVTTEGLQVYIQMAEVSDATLAELRGLGVTIEITDPPQRLVQARVPPAQLETVANLASVTFIRLPDYGVSNR
ncbi:MAG: hypothetical protein ACREJ4_11700 [Candidatus Methylomirabilaceae bacterium]